MNSSNTKQTHTAEDTWSITAGGPAFPSTVPHGDGTASYPGMSIRDWFAGQALAGDLAATPNCRPSIIGVAERAYAYADAMLAARASSKAS